MYEPQQEILSEDLSSRICLLEGLVVLWHCFGNVSGFPVHARLAQFGPNCIARRRRNDR
jgi:hypothetical protein